MFQVALKEEDSPKYVQSQEDGAVYKMLPDYFLKISPWKRMVRFGKRGKLNPRYVTPRLRRKRRM